jgi:hypothetical protein
MTTIIGVSGFARSGKDSFASFLIPFGWKRYALADSLKAAAYALDPVVETETGVARLSFLIDNRGWEDAKALPDVRRLLQRIGTEVGRTLFGENAWIDVLDRKLDAEAPELAVVTDIRFPNEVEWVLSRGGTYVRIERPGVGPANGHASEQTLEEFIPHYTVDNVGDLNDLYESAKVVHEAVTGGQG